MYPDAERAWGDRARHRRRHQDRLAVDADRDLRHIGADLDLLGGQQLQAAACLPRSRPAACRALLTVTPTTPRLPRSSRARRPRPAMSPVPYGLLDTSSACGALIRVPSAWTNRRAPQWPCRVGPSVNGPASRFGDVDGLGPAEQEHLSAEGFGLALEVELPDLPAGLRVHDQVRVRGGRLRRVPGHPPIRDIGRSQAHDRAGRSPRPPWPGSSARQRPAGPRSPGPRARSSGAPANAGQAHSSGHSWLDHLRLTALAPHPVQGG